jgi:hypothetical protein
MRGKTVQGLVTCSMIMHRKQQTDPVLSSRLWERNLPPVQAARLGLVGLWKPRMNISISHTTLHRYVNSFSREHFTEYSFRV